MLKSRWATFVALALGVGLMATMGLALASALTSNAGAAPKRYPGAPVVVESQVPPGAGLQPELVARLSQLGKAVPDHVFYAQIQDGPQVGRSWPAAAYGPYRIVAGRAPAGDEVLVAGAPHVRVGERVPVLMADGPRSYRVSGTATGGEPAVFFAESAAARLSPQVNALIVHAPIERVRAAAGYDVQVRPGRDATGDDPLGDTEILLGMSGGVAGFVAVFVVASTSAFAVAQRRRELALLRLAGATPRQVRWLLTREALVTGLAASVLGCAVAPFCAPLLGGALVDHGLAPRGYAVTTTWWPLLTAFATGLTVSLLGVRAAARRAGRIRPAEALREAALEHRMSPWRWLAGLAVLGTGLWMLVQTAVADPAAAANRKQFLPTIMLLIWGVALLAPVVVPPVARLATWPLTWARGAVALVVRENARTSARRTATAAAPVLVTLGLTAALLGTTATVTAAKDDTLRARHPGAYVVVPAGTPGLNREVVRRVRALPGARTVTRVPTAVDGYDAMGTEGLDDGSIAVTGEWHRRVGDRVDVRLADGTRKSLTVTQVRRPRLNDDEVLVSLANAGDGLAESIDVTLPGGKPALEGAVRGLGAKVVAKDAWLARASTESNRYSRLGMLVVLGIALLYCAIAIAATLMMARADHSALRLIGATRRQVRRLVVAEALVVVLIGAVLAALVTALGLGGLWAALATLDGPAPAIVVPWGPVAGVLALCALIAAAASKDQVN
ncbi:FtsX-like permease family protein [Actinomadura macrotermitis]|uniref:FtsX-like permease family protein n=1 Tax=Actinomadura macrotermitis TaxID=2585200 RepID=UPI001295B1E8|nr:ABC transporter permease [Actinomadura macrotermitis]